jgi:hypothetical protein
MTAASFRVGDPEGLDWGAPRQVIDLPHQHGRAMWRGFPSGGMTWDRRIADIAERLRFDTVDPHESERLFLQVFDYFPAGIQA